jgi:hypothetical protein
VRRIHAALTSDTLKGAIEAVKQGKQKKQGWQNKQKDSGFLFVLPSLLFLLPFTVQRQG